VTIDRPGRHQNHRGRGILGAFVVAIVLLLILSNGTVIASPAKISPLAPAVTVHGTPSATRSSPPVDPLAPRSTRAAAADPSPTWIDVTSPAPNAAPPDLYYGTSAYDPADNETVYFGGCNTNVCGTNYTWVFSRGTWTNITDPYDAPSARYAQVMDYDPNMQAVLLFGGETPAGAYLADTWIFQGGIWTNLTWVTPSYANPPIGRAYAAMAFDPDPEVNGSVLFGGDSDDGYLNTTFVWEAWSGWVKFTDSDLYPPELSDAAMAFDPANDYLVLYGGVEDCLFCFNTETWEFISGNWFEAYPFESPSEYAYNSASSMVYDPALSGLLLFGGINDDLVGVNSTWLFGNGDWYNETPSNAPADVFAYGLSLDPTGTNPMLVGGEEFDTGAIDNSTWVFEVPPAATLSADAPTREAGQPITFTATVSGGTAPYNATFSFGDGTSAEANGTGPDLTVTHTYAYAGSYSPKVNVTDVDGAATSSSAAALTVASGPMVAARATPAAGDVGVPVAFQATAPSPGVPPVTYTWSFGDGTSGTGANQSHAYSAAGTYVVNVTGVDSLGGTSNATINVTVAPDLVLSSLVANPSAPTAGTPGSFYANVTGGTGPFTYSWLFGDHSASAFAAPQHTYSGSGSYTVQVWVNDSAGGSVHGTLKVSVGGAASSAVPLWFIGALVALILVGIVGAVLLLRRNRAGGSASPMSKGPP
jgi:PKD repeat protein